MPNCPLCDGDLEHIKDSRDDKDKYRCLNIQCLLCLSYYYELEDLKRLLNALRSEHRERVRSIAKANPSIREAVADGTPLRTAIKIWIRSNRLAAKGELVEVKITDPEKLIVKAKDVPGAWARMRYWAPKGFSEQHPEGISKEKARRLAKRGELVKTHELSESVVEAGMYGRGGSLVFPKRPRGRMVYHRHWEVKETGRAYEKTGELKALSIEKIREVAREDVEIEEKAREDVRKDIEKIRKEAREDARKGAEKLKKKAREYAEK